MVWRMDIFLLCQSQTLQILEDNLGSVDPGENSIQRKVVS